MSKAKKQVVEALGPDSHVRWRAFLFGTPHPRVIEVPLYSDSFIGGEIPDGLGPYEIVNAWRLAPRLVAEPVLYLRMAISNEPPKYQLKETNTTGYTGTSAADEIAALLSLVLDARLAAGGISRRFSPDDVRGQPVHFDGAPTIPALTFGRPKILPRVHGIRHLTPNYSLQNFGALKPEAAVVVVRAARAYRDAIWIGDSEPELAWLLLVAALEAAAVYDVKEAAGSDVERLRAAAPEIAKRLEDRGGDDLLNELAPHLAPLFKATARFIQFGLKYLPEPPQERPRGGQLDWSAKTMKTILSKVYEHRSRALHDGVPFPAPMCESPLHPGSQEPPMESPLFEAAHANGATWLREDVPIYLQTFAYLARGALLKWWADLTLATVSPET